jgi:hypothetical protein
MTYQWMDSEYPWEKARRKVTEDDFRPPEYRGAKAEDYEFDQTGSLVLKERWESGLRKIAAILGFEGHEFNIEDVVERVYEMQSAAEQE